MQINSSLVNRAGQVLKSLFTEIDNEKNLGERRIKAVHAFCFCGDKLVLVYSAEKNYWSPPGGGVEPGESVSEAVIREVKEETNMRVLKQRLIGVLDISEPDKLVSQTRSFCLVEPIGPFVADPDGDVTEIKLIDPADAKKYFDWGEVGNYVLKRAIELKNK